MSERQVRNLCRRVRFVDFFIHFITEQFHKVHITLGNKTPVMEIVLEVEKNLSVFLDKSSLRIT